MGHVRTHAPQQAVLADYFIGAREKGRRNRDAKGFGGLEVNRQLEFCGLHDRQIGGLFAFQNASAYAPAFRWESVRLMRLRCSVEIDQYTPADLAPSEGANSKISWPGRIGGCRKTRIRG